MCGDMFPPLLPPTQTAVTCPVLLSSVIFRGTAALKRRAFTEKWDSAEVLFKHLVLKRERSGECRQRFLASICRQCEVAVSIHGSVTALHGGVLKSLCSEERASKHASGEPSFSSFYRKGLNSWRQTEPLLYLTGYHKHSCMLHAYCKCVQLDGRVCKHKDATLQHMPKQV